MRDYFDEVMTDPKVAAHYLAECARELLEAKDVREMKARISLLRGALEVFDRASTSPASPARKQKAPSRPPPTKCPRPPRRRP